MRCVNTCASTDGARRAQNCALYTSVCFVVSVPLFAMCSRLFMLCVKMYAVCRSQMFVNMRCRIHSLYNLSLCVCLREMLCRVGVVLCRVVVVIVCVQVVGRGVVSLVWWCMCVVVCVVLLFGVRCVWCGTLKTAACRSQHASVCRVKRRCVYRQHVHYTRGRFESTHGGVLGSTHGGFQRATPHTHTHTPHHKNGTRRVITCS